MLALEAGAREIAGQQAGHELLGQDGDGRRRADVEFGPATQRVHLRAGCLKPVGIASEQDNGSAMPGEFTLCCPAYAGARGRPATEMDWQRPIQVQSSLRHWKRTAVS